MVTGDEDVEGSVLVIAERLAVPELAKNGTILGVTPVRKRLESGYEARYLLLPIVERRGGSDDEERSPDVVHLGEVGHQRDRLNRLSESLGRNCTSVRYCNAWRTGKGTYHLIGEDSVDALLVEVREPVETLELVLLERARQELGLLDIDVAVHESGVLEVELV